MKTPKANVLGVGISAVDLASARRELFAAVRANQRGYVTLTGVHGVSEAQHDLAFADILNNALLTLPDGMPMVWIARLQGFADIARVYGPDLVLNVCAHSQEEGFSHFFYGGQPGVADDLAASLVKRFPRLRVVGTYTPPFRPLTPAEEEEVSDRLLHAAPDFVWVGMSTPKQERFMSDYVTRLPGAKLFIGVGAAFDLLTGRVQQAPLWMQRSGFEWLFRLRQEPRRLATRYLVNNPLFVLRALAQLTHLRNYSRIVSRPLSAAEQ